jgi:hypothetical protein
MITQYVLYTIPKSYHKEYTKLKRVVANNFLIFPEAKNIKLNLDLENTTKYFDKYIPRYNFFGDSFLTWSDELDYCGNDIYLTFDEQKVTSLRFRIRLSSSTKDFVNMVFEFLRLNNLCFYPAHQNDSEPNYANIFEPNLSNLTKSLKTNKRFEILLSNYESEYGKLD